MLDTIKLYTPEFEIADRAAVTIQPGTVDYQTEEVHEVALFRSSSGAAVKGAKAYINEERYNFSILPKGGAVHAFIQFSAPKVINGENYYPVTEQQSGEALEWVNKELWDRGVHLDLNNAKISRVDMFRNAATRENFSSYRPVYELLRCKRQQRRDYGTTFTWGNTQRELCVYSKLEEMIHRGAPVGGLPAVTRFELRFLNSGVVKKQLELERGGELVSNLDHVSEVYNQELVKSLFALTPGEVQVVAASQLEGELRFYRENFGLRWVSKYQAALGARELLLYGEDGIKLAFSAMGIDRRQSWRTIKGINQNWQQLAMLREAPGAVRTMADLYGELKELILG